MREPNLGSRVERARYICALALALSLLMATGEARAQTLMPLPAFDHTLSHPSLSRGFWFKAPTAIVITGLRVPNETGSNVQNLEIVRMNGNLSPGNFPGNLNYVSLFRAVGRPADTVVPSVVRVAAGEVIGILGTGGDTEMENSYAGPNSFGTRIAGFSVTIRRFGTQVNLNQESPAEVWTESLNPLSRVEMFYTKCDNDGVLEMYEGCDDGNILDGDGCSTACVVEPCWTCNGSPSTCTPLPDGSSCEDGVFCNGADQCSAGSCLHAGDPCAGGPECNNACNEHADNCAAAAGTPCSSDAMDCTTDRCDGIGHCAHPISPAATVCRPAAGACDVSESCDGVSPTCPTDGFDSSKVCRIAAGVCDRTETCNGSGPSCPADVKVRGVCRSASDECDPAEVCDGVHDDCPSDVGREDSDGDGVCDLLDPCTNPTGLTLEKTRIVVQHLLTPEGDDRLRFVGRVTLPYPYNPPLDPMVKGVRVLIEDAVGTVVDVTIPGFPFDARSRIGWKPSSSVRRWTYRNAAGWDGITKLVLNDKGATSPGMIKFAMVGKDGSFPVRSLPLKATLVLDPPTASSGQCGEATFVGPPPRRSCLLKAGGDKVVCR